MNIMSKGMNVCSICYTGDGSQDKYKLSPKTGKERVLATTLIYIFLVLFCLHL